MCRGSPKPRQTGITADRATHRITRQKKRASSRDRWWPTATTDRETRCTAPNNFRKPMRTQQISDSALNRGRRHAHYCGMPNWHRSRGRKKKAEFIHDAVGYTEAREMRNRDGSNARVATLGESYKDRDMADPCKQAFRHSREDWV